MNNSSGLSFPFTFINIKRSFPAYFLMLLMVGCTSNDGSSGIDNLESIVLTEDLVIPAESDDVLIGNFKGLSVDKSGNMYVADTRLQKIHQFSSEGRYRESIGREGKGPEEFEGLNSNIKIKSDTLYVLQNNAREIDLFDLNSNQHIRTVNIKDAELDNRSIGSPQNMFPLPNGDILVSFSNPYFRVPEEGDEPHYITVSKINPYGTFIDLKILQLPELYPSNQKLVYLESNSMTVFTTEFYPDIEMASDREGNLYIGKSDSLNFQQYNQDGELIGEPKGISRPVPFTSSDLDSLANDRMSTFKKAVNEAGEPDYWPSFQSFTVDESGRYWVQQHHPGKKVQVWQVLDSNGAPQWKFELPADVTLFEVTEGRAYGIQDTAEGLPSVIRYNYNI
ncbi:6-bladed beta-propeller [Aliifodinibius salicampi]|uniref:6-bladed beta-propeller n=1 Tax=Fodinibius salicampi TaxID=1920655 RepID=A0ABT3PWM9_9BACT|nr:6-bladed beta-propeller [Fodinibius salicampi]MCW9712255.1 6-bladed beta-propeller [Fodinibius salicampi]